MRHTHVPQKRICNRVGDKERTKGRGREERRNEMEGGREEGMDFGTEEVGRRGRNKTNKDDIGVYNLM